MALKPPKPTEPIQRGNLLSDVWFRFFDELARAYGYTVDGISNALAGITDVWASTPDKTFTTGLIEEASAYPSTALVDAATVVSDWDTFVNQAVTITANRILGSPSNPQPGTYRCILVKGSSGTPRTLTFHANFKGAVPSLTDITSTKWYDLTIKCIDATHFTVSAKQAL
jgi:hypothetical protein